ncbi:hypothetical protein HDU76_001422, partial [Blyttiomyces sp. JEL0837]
MATIPESKYRTNITIASFLPFAIGDLYPTFPFSDLIMEMAVNEINADPNILPETYVNLVRYNMWDPDHSADWSYVNSGGFAMKTAMDVAESGVAASSPKLSNKNKYPYEFRMAPPNALIVKGHLQMLQSWNVKRVALVVGSDVLSLDTAKLVETIFAEGGISIITRIDLTSTMVKNHDYEQSYNTLLQADARFDSYEEVVADFYYLSAKYSLISPRHVWMGLNNPELYWVDATEVYGPQIIDLAVGFIGYNFDVEDNSDPPQVKFNAAMGELGRTNERFVPLNSLNRDPYFPQSIYDCTKIMLIGLHKFLENNNYRPEMLSNKSVTDQLLPSVFANTGYSGLNADPLTLDKNGDLQIPLIFTTLNYSYLSGIWSVNRTNAFGHIDFTGNIYTTSSTIEPVFYGGSNIPPPDGPVVTELDIKWNSAYGISLAILSIFGMLLSMLMVLRLLSLRHSRVIKAMSPLFTIIYTIGIFLANLSLMFFIGSVNPISCALRTWLPYLAALLSLGSSVIKNVRVLAIFNLSRRGRIKKTAVKYVREEFMLLELFLFACIGILVEAFSDLYEQINEFADVGAVPTVSFIAETTPTHEPVKVQGSLDALDKALTSTNATHVNLMAVNEVNGDPNVLPET